MEKKKSYPVVLGQMDMNMDMNDSQTLVSTTHTINWEWIMTKQRNIQKTRQVECLDELWVGDVFLEQQS